VEILIGCEDFDAADLVAILRFFKERYGAGVSDKVVHISANLSDTPLETVNAAVTEVFGDWPAFKGFRLQPGGPIWIRLPPD
jgi:hypothetical protein